MDISLVDATGQVIQTGQVVQYDANNNVIATTQITGGNVTLNVTNDGSYYIFSASGFNDQSENSIALLADGASTFAVYLDKTIPATSYVLGVAAVAALILLNKKKKKSVGDLTDDIMPIVLVGGVVLLATGALNKLFTGLGLRTSAAETASLTAGSGANSPWNANFYKQYTSGQLFDQATADATATAIYNAFGMFGTSYDFSAIVAAFKTCSSGRCGFQVSASFFAQHNTAKIFTPSFTRGNHWLFIF